MECASLRNCSCPPNVPRSKVIEMLDELTDSFVLLAGMQCEYRVKISFDELLGRIYEVEIFYGEDHPFENRKYFHFENTCEMAKVYQCGMLLSRICRIKKFGC